MRNPNYKYEQDIVAGGWNIIMGEVVVWGKTKPAARSRLLRVLRHMTNRQLEQKEEANDQS